MTNSTNSEDFHAFMWWRNGDEIQFGMDSFDGRRTAQEVIDRSCEPGVHVNVETGTLEECLKLQDDLQ